MKTFFLKGFVFLLSVCLCTFLFAQEKNTKVIPEKQNEQKPDFKTESAKEKQLEKKADAVPDEYIVMFDEELLPSFAKKNAGKFTNREEKVKAAKAYDAQMRAQLRKLAQDKLGITPAMIKEYYTTANTGILISLKNENAKGLKAKLEQVKEVAGLVPNFYTEAIGTNTKVLTNAPMEDAQYNSWGVNFTRSVNYTGNKWAWIVDTGIDLDHPDLNVNSSYGAGFTGEGMDDLHGHGTHVAGIVAAKNNTIGTLGVAAGARVVPIKVLRNSDGKGAWSWILSGLNHIAARDIPGDVVNMSLGGPAPDWFTDCCVWWDDRKQIESAIVNLGNAGTFVCVAAGNDAQHANNATPARTNGSRVYTISAADEYCNLADFSNYGNAPVDYAAPGVHIISTYRYGGYAYMSGTSMATPFVSGILLANNGVIVTRGTLFWDRDGVRDRIAVQRN